LSVASHYRMESFGNKSRSVYLAVASSLGRDMSMMPFMLVEGMYDMTISPSTLWESVNVLYLVTHTVYIIIF